MPVFEVLNMERESRGFHQKKLQN